MIVTAQPFTGMFVADADHSSFQFEVTHMHVGTFRGAFTDVAASVVVDERGARLEGRIQVGSISIRTPAQFREHVVNGADFFDATNHPDITFRSGEVRLAEDGTFHGEGELTIKGITKPVVTTGTYRAPVEDLHGSLRTAIELHATVDRRDWGMDWQAALPGGGDALGYEVRLSAHIELIGQG